MKGPGGNVYGRGVGATTYNGIVRGAGQVNAVRGNWNGYGWYGTPGWYAKYPNAWRAAAITTTAWFVGATWRNVCNYYPYQEPISYDYGDEITYVYAAGKGEEDERTVQQAYDDTRYGASQWNRCEAFADARDQGGPETTWADAVADVARSKLEAGRPIIRAGGLPQDTAGTRFGLHWNHGDRVRMRYRRLEFDCIVRATVLRMGGDGYETIEARLEYES